ncbi:hypothetical protein AV530_008695 [Patagioenas fasciata monilis]|uniref:Uncharacterized protein n=1 Tax=Patagioenas fasciata monilis TaxID=372326 RepID=A0A1V4L2V3_PATFA|nr:hypothetical protein AV530_008695 [Patagioenas fasciata monilis]
MPAAPAQLLVRTRPAELLSAPSSRGDGGVRLRLLPKGEGNSSRGLRHSPRQTPQLLSLETGLKRKNQELNKGQESRVASKRAMENHWCF